MERKLLSTYSKTHLEGYHEANIASLLIPANVARLRLLLKNKVLFPLRYIIEL
jgi:hypothetical protein